MPKRILLVEDDAAIIDVYTIGLKAAGFEVEVATFGKEMMDKIEKMEKGEMPVPDLLLLDLLLPDMNGFTILENMRSREKTKNIPVFILTNYTSQELERMGYNLQSEKFILKADCSPKELARLVKERLGE